MAVAGRLPPSAMRRLFKGSESTVLPDHKNDIP